MDPAHPKPGATQLGAYIGNKIKRWFGKMATTPPPSPPQPTPANSAANAAPKPPPAPSMQTQAFTAIDKGDDPVVSCEDMQQLLKYINTHKRALRWDYTSQSGPDCDCETHYITDIIYDDSCDLEHLDKQRKKFDQGLKQLTTQINQRCRYFSFF